MGNEQEKPSADRPVIFEARSHLDNREVMCDYIQALALQRLSLSPDALERARKGTWGGFLVNVDQIAPYITTVEGKPVSLKLRTKDGRTISFSSETFDRKKSGAEPVSKQEKLAVLLEAAARYQAVENALPGVENESLRLAEGGVAGRIGSFLAAAENTLYEKKYEKKFERKPAGKQVLQFMAILGLAVNACSPAVTPLPVESTATTVPIVRPTEVVKVEPTAAPAASPVPTATGLPPAEASPAALPPSGRPAERGTVTAVESVFPMAAGLEMRASSHGVPMEVTVGMTTDFAAANDFQEVKRVRQEADQTYANMVLEQLYYGGWLPRNSGTNITFEQWVVLVKAGDSKAGFNIPMAPSSQIGERPTYDPAARWEPVKKGTVNKVEIVLGTAQQSRHVASTSFDVYISPDGTLIIVGNWLQSKGKYDMGDPQSVRNMETNLNIEFFQQMGHLRRLNKNIMDNMNMAFDTYGLDTYNSAILKWVGEMKAKGPQIQFD